MAVFAKLFKLWSIMLLIGAGVYLGVYNRDRITLHFPPIVEVISVPSFVGLMGAFLLGASSMTFFLLLDTTGKSLRIRKLNRRIAELEKSFGAVEQHGKD